MLEPDTCTKDKTSLLKCLVQFRANMGLTYDYTSRNAFYSLVEMFGYAGFDVGPEKINPVQKFVAPVQPTRFFFEVCCKNATNFFLTLYHLFSLPARLQTLS